MRYPRLTFILKWVSRISAENQLKPCKSVVLGAEFRGIGQNPRLFATRRASKYGEIENCIRIKPSVRRKAEAAMLDYFYVSRGLQFMVAESMSKNAPSFLNNLLKKINAEADTADIGQSISRYLWFHPVNEFEPFLESLGLKHSEYSNLVPRDKMFLSEDALLLANHDVFYSYGIAHEKMGKIYKEATEVFMYETEVLVSKIQAYEDLGLNKSCLSKLIVCSPSILIGEKSVELVNVIEILKAFGLGDDWLEESLLEDESYDWSTVHRALDLMKDIGFQEHDLCGLMRKRPRLIFEGSGKWTLMLAGFHTKLGSSKSQIQSLFQQFPKIEVEKFFLNLCHCFLSLNKIEMNADEIGKIFRSHSCWLGTCCLKKIGTLFNRLRTGKTRLCQIIKENPEEMKKWTLRSRIQPLPDTGEETKSKMMKTQFLVEIGYEENSKDMEKALGTFCARGSELRKRYDFIVRLGLSETDVRQMVKACPRILCQDTDILEAKVDYLVNELGYPLSTLVHFPSYLKFSLERIKLRFSMYTWLKEKRKADRQLNISTILTYPDKYFTTRYITRHPDGPEHWDDLKKQIQSS